MSYTHAVYSIEVVGKLFVFHAFIDIPSSLVETKLIFAKVQRALRSIFHGAQSKLSTEHTEGTDRWELDGIILGSLRLEILEEIFFKNGRGPEIIYHSAAINIIFN